ncbi:MAG: TlpA family protein disulfide reductase [Polyangiaceae bacterium]|nr:TlpA family protein disulfide reductase [Polyangiaceae bacterium]
MSIGSTITNYKFIGFANAMLLSTAMQEIKMSDFYNPTGVDTFPEGSPYGSNAPKPKALLIDVSSVWCGPCNYEADVVLPVQHAKYKPQGGEFLLQLADGPTPGKAAQPDHLYTWTSQYDVDYPAAIDPTYKLGALFEADAFPANMIIRTKDMKIVEVVSGAPEADSSFWDIFEAVLNDQPVLPGD